MLKQKLFLHEMINENEQMFLHNLIQEDEYAIRNSVFSEALALFENEGDSHFKRHWGKYATGIGGLALANGGTFGAGAQHATQSLLNAGKNIGHTAFDNASAGLNKSANYYSQDLSALDPRSNIESNGGPGPGNVHTGMFGSDGREINSLNAHKFSEDMGEVAKDKAHNMVDMYGDDALHGAVGAGLGALAGGYLGKKAKKGALGAKIGAGVGGLAGILA